MCGSGGCDTSWAFGCGVVKRVVITGGGAVQMGSGICCSRSWPAGLMVLGCQAGNVDETAPMMLGHVPRYQRDTADEGFTATVMLDACIAARC
jgi:hypothetical protein